MKNSKQYNKLVAQWKLTHHEEDESSSSRGWKDDNENKREKRSFRDLLCYYVIIASRSMARITRSQTTNMVECESATPHVLFHNRGNT